MDVETLLEKFSGALQGSHNYFMPVARRYLAVSGGALDAPSVQAFMERERNTGYAAGTLNRNWRVIRRLFSVAGVPWPFGPTDNPKIAERDVIAPALDSAVVRRLIATACDGLLPQSHAVFLALSTSYGLRRVELSGLTAADVDLPGRTLFVKTAKGGRERYHVIPDELVPVLKGYKWPRFSAFKTSQVFWDLEEIAGLPRLEEVGWHAIRRMLVRELFDAGMNQPAIESYLRWKRSSKDMALRYYQTTVVGLEGLGVAVSTPDRRVDEQAFRLHPWLPLWTAYTPSRR